MENENSIRATNTMYLSGIILIILSLFVYLITGNNSFAVSSNHFGVFFICYGLSIIYFVLMVVKGFIGRKWPFFRTNLYYTIPLVILLTISAFTLNREICVFERMTDWVSVLLILQCIVMLAFPFIGQFPSFMRNILCFCLSFIAPLILYFSIYMIPYYPIALIGSFLFGMSLHVFVPLFMLIVSMRLLYRALRVFPIVRYSSLAGLAIPFVILVVFIVRWTNSTNEINYLLNNSVMNESELPDWINVSQRINKDEITERILKTDLMFSIPSRDFEPFQSNLPSMNFENARQHDPLVFIACLFSTEPDLTMEEKIRILKSRNDIRHLTQERLWSGENLQTVNVISNIKIFSQNRLAYTEKILSIKNTNSRNNFRNQEEAIYTFHLPEGSVVTSLSLWINGEEEKGILTSRSKADTAYKTIVGKEVRDPSVIHWQEGNTVSARIFPCTPDENRRFKIGITSPLKKIGNQLIYENIYFDGPPANHCTESAQVQFDKPVNNTKLPSDFSGTNFRFTKNGSYTPYWEIEFEQINLSAELFSFDGKSYQASEYVKEFERFNPSVFYLDINRNWNENEFLDLWRQLSGKRICVITEEPIFLNEENHLQVFRELNNLNFSLFPFFEIADSNALVITKSNSVSPHLDDLSGSKFGKRLKNYFSEGKMIRVFNFGDDLSPFLKSLKEVRVINCLNGSFAELQGILSKGEFVKSPENDQTVVIHNSSMVIKEDSTSATGKGSDHLMRLFAYNHVLNQIGKDFFTPDKIGEGIIAEATKAWVVSPVSSLIVLETQADYDRFGIEQSKKSLNNASIKGAGAVPEPHEIFLALFVVLIVVLVYYNPLKF